MKKKLGFFAFIALLVLPFTVSAQEVSSDFTLTSDVTDGIVVKSGSNVTVNLNGYSVSNTGGHTIEIEKGATLTLTGNGDVTSNVHAKAVIANSGTLTVKGGTYSRVDTNTNGYYVVLNHGTMTVDGGSFSIENGVSSLIDNGWYTPSQNTDKTDSVLTINGGTFTVKGTNNKYIKNDDYGVLTINGGTFNFGEKTDSVIANVGNASGREKLVVNGGTFNYNGTGLGVFRRDANTGTIEVNGGVYNLASEDKKVATVCTFSNGQANCDFDGDTLGEDLTVVKSLDGKTQMVVKESEIKETYEVDVLDDADVDSEISTLVKDTIKDEYTLANHFDVNLYKEVNGVKVGQLDSSSKTLKVTLDIPSTLEKLKEGYSRTYYVVRTLNGKTDLLEATDNGDGTVSFETDKASTYALVYVDTKNKDSKAETVTNPSTDDNVITYVLLSLISVALISGAMLYKQEHDM